MKNRTLAYLWGALFGLCAGLGFIPEPVGFWKVLSVLCAVLFFVPPVWLAARATLQKNRALIIQLTRLSACSLGLTLVVLVLNFLCVTAGEGLGDFLYGVLVVVSTPMICSHFWVGSLFAWAYLLFFSLFQLKDIPKENKQPKSGKQRGV